MKQQRNKSSTRKPKSTATHHTSSDTLTLNLLGHAYAIQNESAELTPGRNPNFGATTWTYQVTGLHGKTGRVIALFVNLLDFEVASDVFPVTCTGDPESDVAKFLSATTPGRLQVNRAMVTFSDGSQLQHQGPLEISSRLPTVAERTRFDVAVPQLVTRTNDTTPNGHKIEALADAARITRTGCTAVLKAMAELGAMSAGTAKTEKEILKKAGATAKSINGLFATHSGKEERYADFRKKHVKNTGQRRGMYYFDLSPLPGKAPNSTQAGGI